MSGAPVCNVELVVLGSGTSGGVPLIGCRCAVCTSTDPRDTRTRASVCLRFTDAEGAARVVLIDTSPDLRQQALREKLERCDAILFTHDHVDHTFGLDEVRRFNAVMRAMIDVYAEEPTLECLRRVYRHIFAPESNVNTSFVASLRSHAIEPARPVDLFGLRFTPLRLFHGNLPILGFRVEALGSGAAGAEILPAPEQPGPLPLAYCTDVSRIPDETWPQLAGLKHLVLDLLRPKRHPTHFCARESITAALRVQAQRTWFTHMTHDISHAASEAELPARMALAYDGLVLA